jgi:hypothetical protein
MAVGGTAVGAATVAGTEVGTAVAAGAHAAKITDTNNRLAIIREKFCFIVFLLLEK